MTPTLTRPRFAPARNLGAGIVVGAALAGVVLLAAVMVPDMQVPEFVSRLTVANTTRYALEIDVQGADGDGWLSLGGFSRESVRNAYEVIDQGRRWTVRFRTGGVDAGRMTITRDALEENRWRLTVPQEVGDRLAAAGVAPSARF